MKTRNEEIRDFINKYKNLLNSLQMDIAHAELTDRWYLFKYDTKYSRYEFFFEVQDVEDLVNALLSEITFEMSLEIYDDDVEVPEYEENDIADQIESFVKKDSELMQALIDFVRTL